MADTNLLSEALLNLLDEEKDGDVRQMMQNVSRGMRDKYGMSGDQMAQQFIEFIRDQEYNVELETLEEELQLDVDDSGIIDHLTEQYPDLLSSDDQKEALQHILEGGTNQTATKPVIIPYRPEIFQNISDFCRIPKEDQTRTECCTHLQRICEALKHYDVLKSSDMDTKQKEKFVEFNMEIYKDILDDKAHLVQIHGDDLQKLNKEWTEKYGFCECDVTKCAITSRHYRRESRAESEEKGNEQFVFFQEQYDSLHNYVCHLYDSGLRMDTKSLETEIVDDAKEEDLQMVTTDKAFQAGWKKIRSLREKLKLPQNEDESNKYNIKANRSKVTLSDALIKKLLKNDKVDLNEQQVREFDHYLYENGIESDCIEMDLEDLEESNIQKQLQNAQAIRTISNLIQLSQVHQSAFSTGYIFEYWNENEKMYVKPRYNSIKEEAFAYTNIMNQMTARKWTDIETKVNQLMKCKHVRKITAKRAGGMGQKCDSQNRGIKRGDPLTREHLLSLVLYCDYGALCTVFSATFRLENVYEDIESLKERHSKFAHWGQLLVETVLDFGKNGVKLANRTGNDLANYGYERGPFYCGLNAKLNIGTYAIKLKCPLSTSKSKAIAVNFADERGILLRLNNDGMEAEFQCFFDCSTISCYLEENERLWIAGNYPLRIMAIVIVNGAKNYQNSIHALWLFDAMISGVTVARSGVKESVKNYKLMKNLFDKPFPDEYLQKEWNLFLQNKKEITLDFHEMNSSCKLLSELVVHNLSPSANEESDDDDDVDVDVNMNLLKTKWIRMFPELKKLDIKTNSGYEERFEFNLKKFADGMDEISRNMIIIIEDKREWIQAALSGDREIQNTFDAKGWDIVYEPGDEEYFGKLVIKSSRD